MTQRKFAAIGCSSQQFSMRISHLKLENGAVSIKACKSRKTFRRNENCCKERAFAAYFFVCE